MVALAYIGLVMFLGGACITRDSQARLFYPALRPFLLIVGIVLLVWGAQYYNG